MNEVKEKVDKRYCGTKNLCQFKNHYIDTECHAYKPSDYKLMQIWKTCPYKWKPKEVDPGTAAAAIASGVVVQAIASIFL